MNNCPTCEENKAKQQSIQVAGNEARKHMMANNLPYIVVVEDLKNGGYTFCEKNDPRLFTDFHEVQTLLN